MLLSAALDATDGIFCRVSHAYYLRASAVLFFLVVAFNGVGAGPVQPYVYAAQNPYRAVMRYKENYFQESVLLPLLAYYLDLAWDKGLTSLTFGCQVAGLAAFALLGRRRFGADLSLLALALLLTHPVTFIMLSWLGMPDAITFLLTVLLFFTESIPAIAVIAFLGALNHVIIVPVAVVLMLLRRLSHERGVTYWHILAAGAGSAAGIFAVQGFLSLHNMHISTRLDYVLVRDLSTWTKFNFSLLPHTLFSLHSTVWFALGACYLTSFSQHRRYYVVIALYHLAAYAVTFFGFDTTRVFALLTWAPAIHCILYSSSVAGGPGHEAQRVQLRKALLVVALVGFVKPNYFMWEGKLRVPKFNEFYAALFEQLR